MAEIDLHFNRSSSSHLNTYKVHFFGTLVPETCHIGLVRHKMILFDTLIFKFEKESIFMLRI